MKKLLFFLMTLMALSLSWGGAVKAQATHTVYDETTGTLTYNSYVPMYGNYFDNYTKCEFIIPADQLENMVGGEISALKFYIQTVSTYGSGWSSNQQVFLKEVESTSLSAWSGTDDATIVWEGSFTVPTSTATEFEITFSTPYVYQGGNLLVGIYNTTKGGYRNVSWYGRTVNGASGYGNNSSSLSSVSFSQQNFIPKTTFTYTPGTPSTCEKPATLEHSSVTTAGATLTWTGGSGTYNLEVKGGSYTDWTSILSNTALTTTPLTPLDPETQYQVRVQSVCGEEVSGWKTTSFTTPCGILSTFPKTYTFETSDGFPSNASTPTTNQLGNCWRNEATVQNGSYSTRVWGTSTSYKKNGSQSLVLPDKGNGSKTMLVFPAMDFTSTNGYVVSFWIYRSGSSTSPEGFKVYASDCDTIGANAIELGHYSRNYNIAYPQVESASGWYYYETSPITMTGTTYIIFEGQSYYSSATYVDDITIKVAPNCLKPTGLEANNVTTHSADLSWTANSGETAWTLYYKKTSDENYTEVSNVTENPYTLPALDDATNYQFYVVANCSATDNSEASDVKTFTTECEAISALGYSANFDDYPIASAYTPSSRTLPLCWKPINECTYSSYMNYPSIYYYSSTDYSNSSPNSLRFYSYYSSTYDYDPQPQYAILPEMTDLTSKRITLQARGYNTSSTFKVGTMSDPTDVSTFTEITSSPDNPAAMTTSYQKYIFDITNTTDRYVAIMIEAANSTRTYNGVYIDDIVFSLTPTCYAPTEAHADVQDANNATISWTPDARNTDGGSYSILDADQNVVSGAENLTGTSFPLIGLTPETSYTYYVHTNCFNTAENVDDVLVSFTTPASCAAPVLAADAITDITAHNATVTWTGFTSNDEYAVRYRTAAYFYGLSEAFNGTSIPTGWTRYTGLVDNVIAGTATLSTSSGGWNMVTATSNVFSSNHIKLNIFGGSVNYWLVTPEFNLPANSALSFDLAQTAYNMYGSSTSAATGDRDDDRLVVLITTDNGDTWEILREWNNSGSSYVFNDISETPENVNIPLSSYSGHVKVAFYGESTTSGNGDNDMHIDNITMGYSVTAGDWQMVTPNPITTSTTLTDLTAEKKYEVKVNGVCNNSEEETGSEIQTFTTTIACPAPTNLAYSNVAAHTVDLTWNVNGNPTTNYVLTKNGEESNIVVTINGGVATYQLQNLNGETDYTVSVKANCGELDGYSLVSNSVTFTTQVSCAIPTGLEAVSETISSIKLHWTANNNESAWVVAHKIDGTDEFTEVPVAQSDLDGDGNYNLTGLSDGKTYTIKVRANCGETDGLSQWSSEIIHATEASCATPTNLTVSDVNGHGATIGWTDAPVEGKNYIVMVASENMALNVDFENNSIPSNFTNDATYPWYVVANTYSGAYCVRSGGYNINYAESELTVDVTLANDATLTFSAKISSEEDWDKGYFYIDETVQTDLNGISGNGNWINYSYNLSAGAHTLKWKYEKDSYGSSNDDCIYVDNIKITAGASAFVEKEPTTATSLELDDLDPETTYYVKVKGDCGSATSPESGVESFTTPAACNAPTNLTYNDESVTAHTATLSWTENNGATAWKVVYSKTNINNSENTIDIDENDVTINGTTIIYTLGGLTGETTYTVRVKSNCGGIHNDVSAESNSISFITLPACYPVGDVITSDITAYTVTVLWSDFYNAGAYVIKQGENVLDGTTTPSVVIDAENHSAVISGLEPGHTYTNGTFKVFADCGTDGLSAGVNVPYFQTAPSCHPVTNVNITGKTPNSVTFTWEDTYTPETYIIKEGENVLTGETAHSVIIDAMNHIATISGLDENETYSAGTFKVFADCGTTDGQSAGVNIPAFTTPCSAETSFPWTENFESLNTANAIPDCWNKDDGTQTTASYKWGYNTSSSGNGACNGTSHDGSKCIRYNSYYSSNYNYLKTKPLSLPTNQAMQLKFWYKNPTGGDFSVYISTDGGATYATALATGLTGVSDWTEHEAINLGAYAGQDVVIVFKGTSASVYSGDYYIYLDDVTVEEAPACLPVTNISFSDVERTSMTVSWSAHPNATNDDFQLVYSTTELDETALEEANKIDVEDEIIYHLDNLERDILYYVYVRGNCGTDGYSEWVSATQRTQGLIVCDNPNNVDTVAQGSNSNTYAPVYSNNQEQKERLQVIYPAESLTALVGKRISSIRFYPQYSSVRSGYGDWAENDFRFMLGITTNENLNDGWDNTPIDTVHYGAIATVTANNGMIITFNEPFLYTGGNLLYSMLNPGNNKSAYTSGSSKGVNTEVKYMRYATGSNYLTAQGTAVGYLPQVTFQFCETNDTCPAVTNLQPEGVTTESATIKWSASTGDYVGSYQLYYSNEEVNDFTNITPQYTITEETEQPLANLSENTTYHVYVQTVCNANQHDDGTSEWAHLQFTTTANCVAPINVAANLTAKNAATITWEDGDNDADNNNFQYILSTTQITDFSGATPTALDDVTEKALSGLEYATDYYFYVANICGNSTSVYTEVTFTTAAECPGVQNLTASEIGPNTVKLTWEHGQFGEETDWIVYVNNTSPSLQWYSTDTTFTAFGLEPETEYSIGVSASCWDEGHSVNTVSPGTEIVVTTAAAPGDCQQVGNGTGYGNMPVTNFDYAYTQMIYTADNFTQSGNITSLKLQRSSYSNVMNNMKVYLGTTTKSTFANSSDWVPEADLTEVYSGSFATGTEWLELNFSTSPFSYNGTDNLVVAISNGHGNWNSIQNFKYTPATNTVLTRRKDSDDSYADYPGTSAGQSPQSERTNIQFCFEPSACPSVRNLAVGEITTNSAEISWQPGSSESSWKYYYAPSDEALSDEALADITPQDYSAGLSIELPQLNSNTHYFFYIKPNAGNDCSWQHVDFTTIATCLPPTVNAVEEETITSESAIVSWTANTNSANFDNSISTWILRYRKVNTDEWTVNTISAGETSHSVNGLSGNTTYEVQVSSVCVPNVDTSNWSSSVEFTTKCNPITVDADHSFTENFDATTFPPTCWDSVATYVSNSLRKWTRNTSSTNNHSGSIYGSAYSGYYGDIYLILPDLAIANETTDVLFTFWSKNTSVSYYEKNSVVLLNGDNETELWTPSSVPGTNWVIDTINLSAYKGQTVSLAFKYEGNDAHGWYVDDIEVAFVPACNIPANLTASNLTANTATIAWEGNAESYNIHYREVSSFNAIFTEDFEDDATMSNWTLNNCDEGTGVNTVDNNDNAFRFSYNDNPPQYLISPELTGVTEGSKLEFRYKNYQSGYPETFQIGTSSTNNTIDAFTFGTEYTASDVEWHQYSATIPEGTKYICWKYNSNDQYYLYIDDIRVGSVISSNWVDATSTNTSIQLTGLTPGTTYEAEVQSVCGGITSDWSASVNFTPFCNEYLLLTDASNLAVGDKIIIAAANDNAAMSTTQNSNNRGVESIVKNGNTLETPSDEVQILTLAEGSTAGTWALYTGEGYLFAVAASGSNYLRTQETIDANASWTITVSDNKATFKANGSNDKYMRYNNSSSIISCYSSNTTQQPLAIYKFIDNRGKGEDTTIHMVAGSSVTWMGQTFSEYKDYEVVMGTAANGCDSIRVLHVQHKVATPVIDPAAGTYTQPITVTLTCETEGAVIRYSLNGAEETVEYTEPISLSTNGTTTISAFAMKNGIDWERSETVEAEYIIDIQPRTVRFDAGTGSYTGGDLTEATALAGITLPTAEACSTVEGYTFAGWSYEAVATATTTATTLFAAGETFHPATDTILYAVYSKTETGSGSTTTESTVDFSEGSYNNGVITWELSNVVSIVQEQHTGSTAPNSSYVSAPRWYSGNMITITPDVNISSLTVTATSSSYASALNNSTYTNATTSLSGSVVTITPTNGENPITIVMDGQSRISSLAVTYTSTGSGSTTTYNSNPECTIFYHIYTSNNTSANGSFTINPEEAAEGTPVTLTPTVDNHYHLTGWSLEDAQGGSLDITVNPNNNTFNMPASDVYVAMQTAIDQFTITVNAENGTVNDGNGNPTTGGTYDYDTEISLTPVAANGYHFANWTVNGNEVSGQPLVFHVTTDSTIVANFELNSYEVTATANPTAGGTITGAGTYTHGAEATLIATVNEGYYFVGWTKNGQTASTSTTYSFTVEGPDNYVANFDTISYNITATANPTAGGTVTGAGEYKHFKTVTLTASANEGYYFVSWTKDGQTVSTSTAYTITVGGAENYVANFDTISYNIAATANPAAGGSITGAGSYKHFTTATLTATANTGYTFTNWTEGTTVVSTDATYSFEVTDNRILLANFSLNSYEITATTNPTEGGTVSGAGTYEHGASATLTATANEGYTFTNWTKGGVVVSTSSTYEAQVTETAEYIANFALNSYEVNATTEPIGGGSVSGTGTYNHGATATLTATANDHYNFVNWTEGGNVVSTEPTCSFTVEGNRNLLANFTLQSYEVTVTANPTEGGTVTGAGTYIYNTTATLTATANTGYYFVNWTKNGTVVSTSTAYSVTVTEDAAYVANFELNSYEITATANPTEGGSVSGAGTYNHFESITLTATPATGYTFINWTKNGTLVSSSATYTFTVTEGGNYVATFSQNSYEIAATANPTAGGTITGAGSYAHGQTANMVATPATGYHFVNWTKNGTEVSTNATYSFTVEGPSTLVANFELNSYAITATVNPTAGGTVNGAGTYNHFATVTLTATPASGYVFVNWTKNGTPISTDATYTFTATEAIALVANFELNSYNITASANPTDGGTVAGAGSYEYNTNATLTATANPGYTFVNWTKNGTAVSTNPSYSFTVTEDVALVANFSQNSYTITATANPTAGGTVSGAGDYNYGTSITLTATPAEGYTFTNWTKGGAQVSTSASYTFTVEEAGDYVANFTLNSYTINVTANPTAGGTVSGAGNYDYGTNANLTATASTGYTFSIWTKNGMEVSTNASYSFNVTEAATYVANFTLNSYAINAAADPTEGGTVTGTGTYNHFGSATLTATPAAGYAFINWTKNGTVVSTTSTYTFTVEAAGDYVAHFSQNSYEITATANPTAGGTIEGAGNYVHGASATLTATPATGYSFTNWTKNGTVVSTNASYSFTVTEAAAYVANFTLNSYAVTVAANPTEGGTVSGAGTFNHGTSTTLTATPATGYAFVNWTKNDAVVSTSATYTFNVTEAGAYVANFSQNTYAISAVVTPEGSGSVTGTGNYTHGATATLTATANEGYNFTNWTDGSTVVSTDATYSFTVESARSLKANFTLKTYTIATTANPVDGGVVTGAGTYNHGATANLTATANTGYTFTNWTKGGEVVSTSATYNVTVTEAATYVANFTLNSYAINATANPTEGGTVSGAGTYNHGATANLTATANTGYSFTNWTKNGAEVSTSASLSITVTEAADYVANFSLNSYELTVAANPTEGGTVSGAGTYNHGATANLTATANTGYSFTNWTKNGTVVSTNATLNVTVTEAAAYVANFTLNNYELTVTASPAAGGTVTGAGTYNHGATANLTATANTGYYFVNWTKNGSVVSSSTSCSVTVTEAAEYVANFSLNSYEVTVSANPTAGGTVSGAGSYNHGATVTLTATPADNYTFTNWTKNGAEVSTNESYSFTATEGGVYVANFTLMGVVATPTFSVASGIYYEAQSVNINCSTNGATIHYTTDGSTPTELSSVFNPGTPIVTTNNGTATIKAIAMKENMITSEMASAVYRIVPKYNVVVTDIEHGTVTANPTSDTTGAIITLTAVAEEGYSFNDAWTVTNATTGNPIDVVNNQFTMPASNVTVSATFTLNSYTVSATANPTAGGTVSGAGTYNHNETATLTATANEGYYFVSWTKNSAVVSTSTAHSFTVTEDNDYVANFATSSYNVTLHPNGGTINSGNVTSYTYTEGATLPTDVTLTGNSFGGWFDNANLGGTAVTAIAATETGNKEFWAKWTVNSYLLTINYKYADGSQAAPSHTENVNYNTAYDVASPVITGYTPSLTTVSGTMGTEAVTVNVVYNINSYDLTINYKYADGSQAAPTHSETLNYNVGYSVNSPVITGYTADQTTVSGTMGTEAVTVNVTYNINSYDLTINYKYANGTQAAPAHTESINYNVGYSVTSPAITGYTPSQAIVSGTMGTANVTVDVIYNINSYALTINYKYADGTTAATTHTENINYNTAYSVTSPVITGYTANQTTVSGTMGTEPVTVDVTYNINSYNLTINYKYANGTQAAASHTESVNYNVAYTVSSPVITGYTPSQTTVSGTMGTENVTVEVIYNINSYALTINYQYADGSQAAPTYTQNINYNATYSVNSPAITGYTASQASVSGTMGTEAVTITVTYTINSYDLTINYKYADGSEAAPSHSESVNYNVAYSVTSPVITGYTASQASVNGTMGTSNVTVNVTYSINSYNLVINYKYADGSQAAPAHSESVNYNAPYAVTSPVINDYVASRTTVAGTMSDNNLTVNVTYYMVTTSIVDATNCGSNGNGSITVTAPTGNFEYSINGTSYQSSNVFNGLSANDYTLYIRPIGEDFNYMGTWTVASIVTMPTVSVASNDSLFCLNGTVSLNGNGSSVGPEFTYAWEGPAGYSSNYKNPSSFIASNGNVSGTYTLTVTNTTTQCASSKSLNIYVNDVTNPDYVFTISGFNAVGNIALGESSATANILTPTINHFLDGIVENYITDSVTVSNNAPAEYTAPGNYEVIWTAVDACGNIAKDTIMVTITNSQCPMVQDVDGNIYSTVAIGSTCWMNSNLKTTHYADGREITNIYKYYYQAFPNVEENVSIYGLLYDWYDALDVTRPTRSVRVQGICPDGWYLPNEEDFEQLNTIPTNDLRSTSYWLFNQGTNASGYDLRPGGMYNHNTVRYEELHGNAYLWSATEINSTEAHCHMADCHCYMLYDLINSKLNAYSVRCVRGE